MQLMNMLNVYKRISIAKNGIKNLNKKMPIINYLIIGSYANSNVNLVLYHNLIIFLNVESDVGIRILMSDYGQDK